MNVENLKVHDTVKWNDPNNGLCSGPVVVMTIDEETEVAIVRRLYEDDSFEVPAYELSPLPKPNEIWRTQSGNYVLVVEHPMTDVKGNLGFIWFDDINKNLNFCPLEDQLVEKMDHHTVSSWGAFMSFEIGEFKKN